MRLNIACAYCGVFNPLDLSRGLDLTRRDVRVALVKCIECDSTTELVLSTKRRSKGKTLKAREAVAKQDHATKVAAAMARNERITIGLLAESGCTCMDKHGAIRSGGVTNGVPQPPRHWWGCPANKGEEE